MNERKEIHLLTLAALLILLAILPPAPQAETRSEWRNGILVFYDTTNYETVEAFAPVKVFDEFVYSSSSASVGIEAVTTVWIVNTNSVAASAGGLSIVSATGGIARLTCGASDNDDQELASDFLWSASKACAMEARIRAGTSVIAFCVGFSDSQNEPADTLAVTYSGTTLTSTASDCAVFFFDSDATTDNIYAVAVKGDTDGTVVNSGVSLQASTWHVYRVEINENGDVDFWLDGVHVGSESTGITTNVPLCVYLGVIKRDSAAGSVTLDVDYIRAWQRR